MTKYRPFIFTVVSILIILISLTLYEKFIGSYETASDQICQKIPGSDCSIKIQDWRLLLNKACHSEASKIWCQSNGLEYDAQNGTCGYNEQTCRNVSNNTYKVGDSKPFLQWDSKNGKCIVSTSSGIINNQICKNKMFRTEFNADLGFTSGEMDCDKDGNCKLSVDCTNPNNFDSNKCPTCIIPAGYCQSKGLDHANLGGIGDCTESDVQAVFEAIFGKTITRTFKRNFQNMTKQCSQQLFSANCAKGIGTMFTTGEQMILKTWQKHIGDLMTNFKKECGSDFTKTSNDFVNCAHSMLEFAPGFFLGEMGIKMLDGMMSSMFGWTGLPNGILQSAVSHIVKYGVKALSAVLYFGERAVLALDKVGHMAIAFLDKIGLGPLADAPVFVIAMAGLDAIVKYGGQVATALAHIGVNAVHLLIKVGAQVAKVLNASIGALLHPVDFAKHLLTNLEDTAKNPKKLLSTATVLTLKGMKEAGQLSKQTLVLFKSSLKIGGKALEAVWNEVNKELNKIEDGLEDATSSIGDAVSSLF